jgi:hypothetical protein
MPSELIPIRRWVPAVSGPKQVTDPDYHSENHTAAWESETPTPPKARNLTPEDVDRRDDFGDSVGVSSGGTTAVIGTLQDEDPNGSGPLGGAGSAYVSQQGGGNWAKETKLTPEDGNSGDRFGVSNLSR